MIRAILQIWALIVLAISCLCFVSAAQDEAASDTVINAPFDGVIKPVSINPIDDMRLDRLMRAYEADESLQKERPVAEVEDIVLREFERREPSGFAKFLANVFSAIGPIIGYFAIIALVIAVALALYFMFGESLSLRGKQKAKTAGPDVSSIPDLRPDARQANALLGDADALAAQGRYAEAVHMLLFRSIEHIQAKQAVKVPRSLTAREIGQLEALTPEIREALSPIIEIVERSYFGGRDVGQSDWDAARASYQVFAFGEATT